MRKSYRYLATTWLMAGMFSIAAFAQNITISGSVRNSDTKESVPAVTITVKGTNQATFTDDKGNFRLTVAQLPVTLVISSVGYAPQEITVSNATDAIVIDFVPRFDMGDEIVVAATRTPQRILESPVTVERMSTAAIRNVAVPNYYDATANLKGVDLTTSSLTFRTVSTRGFNGSGNLRFNQLVDGMDNQAPGLNFSVGSVVGPTVLDVDNVELLSGASSALYGSGGMNGTLLITSKDPWKYQGLSFEIKQGIMHVDGKQRPAAPYYDWAVRWGKKVSEKFAFKLGAQLISAKDWQAEDYRNLQRNNVFSSIKDGDRMTDPNYDGVNVFGDEASALMPALATAVRAQVTASPGSSVPLGILDGMIAGGATPQMITTFFQTNVPQFVQYLPFLIPTSTVPNNPYRNTFGGQFVSRTGYEEKHLVDYNTYNLKLTGGLYYKISNNVEASLLGYFGTGTTVYTGADRYALRNLRMGQYKLEFKGRNWMVRAATTQENSGDSYTATTAAVAINNSWKSNTTWFQQYTGTYGAAALGIIPNPAVPGTFFPVQSPVQSHNTSRGAAEAGRLLPGTTAFTTAFNNAIKTPISKGGAKFEDATDLYHIEGQLNLTEYVKFAEVLVGAAWRRFNLNSNGTIFADTAGTIGINEIGGYVQLQRWFIDEKLKLTVSGRYDKNENFDGRFTPRATALIKVAQNSAFRLSYQQAYRFPSTQDQWINLQTPASRLIGMAQHFKSYFQFDTKPAKTAESIVAYRNSIAAGAPNPGLLVNADFPDLKPETSNSYELGFRGLVIPKLLIDAYVYYSQYNDFISRVAVGRGVSASSNPAQEFLELASPFTTTNYSFVVNSPTQVKAIGWGIGAEYQLGRGYVGSFNISSDKLRDLEPGFVAFFNTPELRYNIGLSNPKVWKNLGFNVIYRWQDDVYWEGTFGTGNIQAFSTLDAQVSWRMPSAKSQIKLGASNLLNKYYTSAFGNPQVGGLYYVSFGYNVF